MLFPSSTSAYAIRLQPGRDLKRELLTLAAENFWRAAAILTCVGSLSRYNLRFAGRTESIAETGSYEILSLVGTLSASAAHLHLTLGNEFGHTLGGHVSEGCVIRTTAEIVIVELNHVAFARESDSNTGFNELVIHSRMP